MKNILSVLLFFLLIGSANAESFVVGEKVLEIPPPRGFYPITPKMDAVYRLSLQMADPMNDQLAYYISESDVPVAMTGEIPSLKRYFILKVNKKLKALVIGTKDFNELKNFTKQKNKELVKSVEAKIPALMDKMSKGISKELDVDLALKLSQMVPLDPHDETDNTFAYSMYINFGITAQSAKKDLIVAATATFVNVAGKVLFLYCYGSQEDLEWTRSASKAWAARIIESNALPPSRSSGSVGFNWSRILEEGIVGAIVGVLLAMLFSVYSRFKKKGA